MILYVVANNLTADTDTDQIAFDSLGGSWHYEVRPSRDIAWTNWRSVLFGKPIATPGARPSHGIRRRILRSLCFGKSSSTRRTRPGQKIGRTLCFTQPEIRQSNRHARSLTEPRYRPENLAQPAIRQVELDARSRPGQGIGRSLCFTERAMQ